MSPMTDLDGEFLSTPGIQWDIRINRIRVSLENANPSRSLGKLECP
jgi:hypothetical protein